MGDEMTSEFSAWFARTAGFAPYPWQVELGDSVALQDRLLRIPTGFGKTAGVVLGWLYNAVARADARWPRICRSSKGAKPLGQDRRSEGSEDD